MSGERREKKRYKYEDSNTDGKSCCTRRGRNMRCGCDRKFIGWYEVCMKNVQNRNRIKSVGSTIACTSDQSKNDVERICIE